MSTSDRVPPDPFAADPQGYDTYREWDAGYVLGALSPAERREFEEHLAGCAECQAAIAELAGMPGLLAQISPDAAAAMVSVADPATDSAADPARGRADETADLLDTTMPAALVPRVVGLRVRQRRLATAVVALAAALVLLAGVVGVAALRGTFEVTRPSAGQPLHVAFVPVVPSSMTANATLVPVSDGTQLDLECQYADEAETGHDYDIYILDRSGQATVVKTWKARPKKINTPSATSPLPVSRIAAVEIRPHGSDQAWLRAELR